MGQEVRCRLRYRYPMRWADGRWQRRHNENTIGSSRLTVRELLLEKITDIDLEYRNGRTKRGLAIVARPYQHLGCFFVLASNCITMNKGISISYIVAQAATAAITAIVIMAMAREVKTFLGPWRPLVFPTGARSFSSIGQRRFSRGYGHMDYVLMSNGKRFELQNVQMLC